MYIYNLIFILKYVTINNNVCYDHSNLMLYYNSLKHYLPNNNNNNITIM